MFQVRGKKYYRQLINRLIKNGFIVYLYFEILNLAEILTLLFSLPLIISRLLVYGPTILLFGILLLVPQVDLKNKIGAKIWLASFLLYLAFGMLATLIWFNHIPNMVETIPYYSKILFELFFFTLFLLTLEKTEVKLVIKNFTVAYIIIAFSIPIMAYYNIALFNEVNEMEGVLLMGRPAGLAGNANPAAFQSILGFILILYWLMQKPTLFLGVILSVLSLSQIACAVLTFSNTGMISLVAVTLIAIYKISFLSAGFYRFIGVLVICLVVLLQSTNFSFLEQMDSSNVKKLKNFKKIVQLDSNIAFSQRDSKLKTGIKEYLKSPVLGNGIGYFKHELSVHNTYLTIIGESGIFPFLLFTLMIIYFFKTGFLAADNSVAFLFMASITAFALFSLTLQNMIDQLQYHVYFMLLGLGANNFKSNSTKA